jgi:hypothetical protein
VIYYKKKDTAILAGKRKARAYRKDLQLFTVAGEDGYRLATRQDVKRFKSSDPSIKVNVVMTFIWWQRGAA